MLIALNSVDFTGPVLYVVYDNNKVVMFSLFLPGEGMYGFSKDGDRREVWMWACIRRGNLTTYKDFNNKKYAGWPN